eukprot:CAMPEP_0114143442 /NCGR_PEP_ID=MMETSP0043_2-20121206/18990_1 /TAXON_ID=464988 /ORGANISM="Hemiselmis andersenii, Strain CCMP644" /LENGTH=291 /DNA_ID=CAMNT_0001237743 /DNA_START=34 /DNA_END=905 /DNA_ORIENTATION=-
MMGLVYLQGPGDRAEILYSPEQSLGWLLEEARRLRPGWDVRGLSANNEVLVQLNNDGVCNQFARGCGYGKEVALGEVLDDGDTVIRALCLSSLAPSSSYSSASPSSSLHPSPPHRSSHIVHKAPRPSEREHRHHETVLRSAQSAEGPGGVVGVAHSPTATERALREELKAKGEQVAELQMDVLDRTLEVLQLQALLDSASPPSTGGGPDSRGASQQSSPRFSTASSSASSHKRSEESHAARIHALESEVQLSHSVAGSLRAQMKADRERYESIITALESHVRLLEAHQGAG